MALVLKVKTSGLYDLKFYRKKHDYITITWNTFNKLKNNEYHKALYTYISKENQNIKLKFSSRCYLRIISKVRKNESEDIANISELIEYMRTEHSI